MRFNLEDAWYKFRGRTRLVAKLLPVLGGDDTYLDDLVDGVWSRANVLAQPYWLDGKKLVPLEVWDAHPAGKILLETGCAERRETGIYVALIEEQYADWYKKSAKNSENAKKRLEGAQRDEQGRLLPAGGQPDPANAGQTPATAGEDPANAGDAPAPASDIQPSGSSSASGSSGSSGSSERENAHARGQAAPGSATTGSVGGKSLSVEELRQGFENARDEWLSKTLPHFKAGRPNLLEEEEQLIVRSIQRWGIKPVRYAIWGKRHEPKDPNGGYDPGKNLSLRTILNHKEPEKFERLMNLGIQAHTKGLP